MQPPNQPETPAPSRPRPGYTLPVFACAAAIAALRWLNEPLQALETVSVDLRQPPEQADIAIESVARLDETSALAIARSDPGDNLDLTRHTPVWAWVRVSSDACLSSHAHASSSDWLHIKGGEGIGRRVDADGAAAIYHYAHRLLVENLERWRLSQQRVEVTLVLPEGRSLAQRTSNEAFGVVDGLSLLGTTGISQPLSAPGQLELYRHQLRQQATGKGCLVFCVGENGLHRANQLGISAEYLVKTANWLGPMLVEAGNIGLPSILLFGYHGKLIKLAGGIFHTHHHVADGRQEILAAACVRVGVPPDVTRAILDSPTVEKGLTLLREIESTGTRDWVQRVYGDLVEAIDGRSQAYIYAHCQQTVAIGTVLFDRQREIITCSQTGDTLLSQVC